MTGYDFTKHRTILMVLAILFCCYQSQSQQLSPQVVSSVGATMNQTNAKLSFTVGEIVVTKTASDSVYLGQGFINSATTSTHVTAIKEPSAELINIKVYPNPVGSLLNIDIIESKLSGILLKVVDINGRVFSSEKYSAGNNHIGINTESWNSGVYFIKVLDNNQALIGNYKIIKQ